MAPVAVVTGGSRGIGAACVRLFADRGWRVAVLCEKNAAAAEALCAELRGQGRDAAWQLCDVADEKQVSAAFGWVRERFGPVSALVNNAGISWTGLLQDMTAAEWDRLFAVNVRGAFLCARAVLPEMISRRQGSIVQVSSMWGETGGSCETAYSASKAALIGLTRALAKEAGPSGVRVNCVSPGVIDTEMNSHLTQADLAALAEETPLGRIGQAEEVARAVLFLCGAEAAFITGQVLPVNGGIVIG